MGTDGKDCHEQKQKIADDLKFEFTEPDRTFP